jgi:hypothetical protein
VAQWLEGSPGSSAWSDQGDGPLGAGHDAQSASAAGVGIRRVGGLAAMGEYSQLGQRRQTSEVAVVDSPYLEHVVGAHHDAVPFRFASTMVDDRGPSARRGVAPLAGALGVLSRPALLGQGQLFSFSGRCHLSYHRYAR